MNTYLAYRKCRYVLWSRTRQEPPSRRLDAWHDHLHRMNQDESWAGLRFRAGQLRDSRGRFANPDKEISA